jgi:hypothetical protein
VGSTRHDDAKGELPNLAREELGSASFGRGGAATGRAETLRDHVYGRHRRLRRAESEWWGLLRKTFLVCLTLVALLLWYMNSYSETRGALNVACAFIIAREANAKIKEETLAEDLKEVNGVCNEKATLGTNTIETPR